MFLQRGKLGVDRLADVHPGVGFFGTVQVEPLDVVRLEAFLQQLGEEQARPGRGEDGVRRCLGGGAVVGVVDVPVAVEHRLRVAGHDHVGLVRADEFGQLLAQGERRLELAVGVVQVDGLFDAEQVIRGVLLALAQAGEVRLVGGIMRRVVGPRVAAGDDDRDHLAPGC